jgi:MoaA/NifB/PqqE/SkfB family radical SAM enzyme
MKSLRVIFRRRHWFLDNLTPAKVLNYLSLGATYLLKREIVPAWPAVLKVDISPACNLSCPVCVHADPGDDPLLRGQSFKGKRMPMDRYRQLVDEARGKVAAFSLYYLGDPFAHPEVDAMCRVAHEAGINVHLSTNFSFRFSDDRIARIARSGVTHLTVAVDGFSQETYGRTRVGGDLALVLSNLERLCAYKKQHGLRFPRVEVQYIKFNHNLHELPQALAHFERLGLDNVETLWGMVSNYAELEPSRQTTTGPLPETPLPRCYWPFAFMTIKYDGDVIPCCNFRHATQYVPGEDSRALGNVFESGLRAVWDSAAYRETRRMCGNPAAGEDPALAARFCHGCPQLYQTGEEAQPRFAPAHDVGLTKLRRRGREAPDPQQPQPQASSGEPPREFPL